jgi:flagellar motor switch protein FliM
VVSALGEIPVSVDVRLPCIRISMTDMATLGVGDFLDLGYDLSGRVRVVGANVDVDLVAVLGQHDSHKAIRIETLQ